MHTLSHLTAYPASRVARDGAAYTLARDPSGHRALIVEGDAEGFVGERQGAVILCPLTPHNAAALRARLPWLVPIPLGLQISAGFGDRLGLATPGHARAVWGTGVAPIFAQQSVRENARTGRTPQQVLDDAMWGAFEAGWRHPWGADADHVKVPEELDPFIAAGYTFFVFDPGAHVDNAAHTDPEAVLREKVAALPWVALRTTPADQRAAFLKAPFDLGGFALTFDEAVWMRAAAKYGRAIAHAATMYQALAARMDAGAFEVEVSVDETETPTSVHEHLYISHELRRLGVTWVSLAPRFVGRFEKGVDYIGELDVLDATLDRHAAVARAYGDYKLSLHSGSDKFSVYPLAVRRTRGRVHLKTAGTSYLEALRVMARCEPEFFRRILDYARERYPQDRASYHVSAALENVPASERITDAGLPDLLDRFDARQVLHVTYGSVLAAYGAQLKAYLVRHEEAHYAVLEKHFTRHLLPFNRSLA